jgi:hypothetical protein
MHLEQPRPRLEIKWEILAIFEPQLKKFKCLLKVKGKLETSAASCPHQDLENYSNFR